MTRMASYLDFNDLRNEGIAHLGNLTGKIWTDYNAHDPGITILEVLCYALLDLDYRSKLPAADIFAHDPKATGPDNNFYSPAQILACNPLTIADYRKLLSDIEGVRNAWLEVATDQVDQCLPQNRQQAGYQPLLNGLYHVYIEADDNIDTEKLQKIILQTLNGHRNLCEDMIDPVFLGKQKLGIDAGIELETDADPMQVYLDMMQKLESFLSPSPFFYTLQELLDKGKPIDTIFAGRPYSTSISHGFIDTDELEQIQLKKEIHLSDLYKALFEVSGIKTIRDLQWKPDGGAPKSGWKFNISKDHTIDFNPDFCAIRFLRNGKPVPFDATQYSGLLQVAMKKNLYRTLLPNLDLPYPQGTFRSDLADYYSIQNDFPNVYGITKGGIPDNAPYARKAWALQLKGFLLFFDQLLADYLAQLANIRNLFSFGGNGGDDGNTYFLNPLDNGDDPDGPNYVPDVNKLWRSYISDSLATLLGTEGSTLVSTTNEFADWNEMQDVITRLKADFEANLTSIIISPEAPYTYTISTSNPDLNLISKKTFTTIADAKQHAAYVQNVGAEQNTYSLFSIAGDKFTFTLEYHPAAMADVLQTQLEDAATYTKRRQFFLDHLMARFAERFTDFALLQFGPTDPLQKAKANIAAEENYLSQYAVLSSKRGQAGDYTVTKWNSYAISGLEQKWRTLIGAGNGGRQSLCNFMVSQAEIEYNYTIKIGDKAITNTDGSYPSEEQAKQGAAAVIAAMADRSKYTARPGWDTVQTSSDPVRWKFHFYLGTEDDRLAFDSVADYESQEAALDALKLLWQNLSALHVQQEGAGWTILADDPNVPAAILTGPGDTAPALLKFQQELQHAAADPAAYTTVQQDAASQLGLFTWLLADKDHPLAFCTTGFSDKATAEQSRTKLIGLLRQGLKYLEICMDSRITRKRKDGYHYIIKSGNYFYSSGKQMILFESVKGYPTEDEAKQVFQDKYISLMEAATKESSYGPIISLTEQISSDATLFVPRETKVALGGADADVIKKLIDMTGTFPIKSGYYCGITIPNPDGTPFEWKSIHQRKTIAEAQLDFTALIRLLTFPENIFIDTHEQPGQPLVWRLYIHEILAESAGRFATEEAAWGPDGIEKFITALRSKDQPICYESPNHCAFTFLVNSGQPLLEHPCTYSTPKARDEALQQLIDRFPTWDSAKNNPIVQNPDGKFVIEIAFTDPPPPAADASPCAPDWISTTTYDTPEQATQALETAKALLADSKNYLPTFTGSCRCFTITLSDPNQKTAIHPQSYNTREAVIDAVKRTRKAVNAEGLHLIEHILLRPRATTSTAPAAATEPSTTQDFCGCASVAYPKDPIDTTFPLDNNDPDPCQPPQNNIYIPDNDPWSFIATVALPAWPEKFNTPDNRVVLENALQRETPAHIMLRILWLDPHDCCAFETQYKSWLKEKDNCEFIKYLFTTNFKTA